jgi:hypothetical protein
VEDVLDGYIVAAGLRHFGMETMDGSPTKNAPSPLFSQVGSPEQRRWILKEASTIRQSLVDEDSEPTLDAVRGNVVAQDEADTRIDELRTPTGFQCYVCQKLYKREGYVRAHMMNVHGWEIDSVASPVQTTSSSSSLVSASFVKMAFIARDTYNAYRMCDGDRVFRNAKFEFLYADSLGHTKYRLWLWRMVAYEAALLSARESHEYKWNVSVNLQGGVGKNIPNDNCVELQVRKIKAQLDSQGGNKSFQSAQIVCKTSQVVD